MRSSPQQQSEWKRKGFLSSEYYSNISDNSIQREFYHSPVEKSKSNKLRVKRVRIQE